MASDLTSHASTAFRDGYDEVWSSPEVPRPEYEDVLRTLSRFHRPALRSRIRLHLSRGGVTFGSGAPFVVDPVPRVITAAEWAVLAAGLTQRVRALEAFVQDAYADRKIVSAGIVEEATIDEAVGFEPELRGRLPGVVPAIGVAGLDVVRDRDGAFLVLEDNLRTPSGFAYAAAARSVIERELLPTASRRPFADEAFAALAQTLVAAVPDGGDPSDAAILTDGIASSSAFYEHDQVARRLGLPLVTLSDLELHDGRLVRRGRRGRRHPVAVVYRRCNEDRMRARGDRATPVAALLAEPWLDGRLGIVNAFGTGVADDKAVHAYVEDMIGFYLREKPLLRSVPTLDLANDEHRRRALEDIERFVIKPRHGQGGQGVVVCAHASEADVTEIVEEIKQHPSKYVAQRTIALSRHPTMLDSGALAPRHVDLRPFAFATPDAITIPAGGLTRVALEAGALVVNSSQDGGGKDTWVMA